MSEKELTFRLLIPVSVIYPWPYTSSTSFHFHKLYNWRLCSQCCKLYWWEIPVFYFINKSFYTSDKGFPGSSDVKESACNAGIPGLIPGLGRSPGEGNGNPLLYSCHEQRSLVGCSPQCHKGVGYDLATKQQQHYWYIAYVQYTVQYMPYFICIANCFNITDYLTIRYNWLPALSIRCLLIILGSSVQKCPEQITPPFSPQSCALYYVKMKRDPESL